MENKEQKSFGEIWAELTPEQSEYLKGYIDRQRQDAVNDYISSQPINSGWVSVETIPSEQEIDSLIEINLPNSIEYQKYDKDIQSLLVAATKAGAKWFRSSLIEGSYT
jgi:hypothetical protein